jgi:hypothetical protein
MKPLEEIVSFFFNVTIIVIIFFIVIISFIINFTFRFWNIFIISM